MRIIDVLLLVTLAPVAGSADVCVPDELTVNWPAGEVISTYDGGQEAIADATVELLARDDLTQPIKTVHTAQDGTFVFRDTEDGQYVVRVSREGFATFAFPVRLIKKGTTPRTLFINRGVSGVTPCGGGWAKVVSNAV